LTRIKWLPANRQTMRGMRIQVDCRDGDDPRAFYLGTRRLHIVRILERIAEDSTRRFKVRIDDGRVFVLVRDSATGEWRLKGVGDFPYAEPALSSQRIRSR
jgi:hypothetical protein